MKLKNVCFKINVCVWVAASIMGENAQSIEVNSEKEFRAVKVEFASVPAFHAKIQLELEKIGMRVFHCDYDELAITLGVKKNEDNGRFDLVLFWYPPENERFPGLPSVKLYQTNDKGETLTSKLELGPGLPLPVIAPQRVVFNSVGSEHIRTASYRKGMAFSFNHEDGHHGADLGVFIPIYEKIQESPGKSRLGGGLELRPGVKIGD